MKRVLPDINTLLALLDPMHLHHDAAHAWYERSSPLEFLLASHVENGVIRVASQPKYPNFMGTGRQVREILRQFSRRTKAKRCERDVSLLDDGVLLDPSCLTPPRVSDLYLLALAAENGARFSTFDSRIPASAVKGGMEALEIIPSRLES